MTLELFLCQNAGMVRKFLGVQTNIDNPLPSQDPSRPFTPACGSPNKACTPWCREGWEDPPFSIWWSQHWAMACPHGSHTGLDGEAKGLQGLLFLGKYKRYGSRIAGSRFFTRNFLGVGHRKPRHAWCRQRQPRANATFSRSITHSCLKSRIDNSYQTNPSWKVLRFSAKTGTRARFRRSSKDHLPVCCEES